MIFAWTNIVNIMLPEQNISSYSPINKDLHLINQRNSSIRGLITSLTSVAVGMSVFYYYKKKVKRK
ncbi:MAG: hypothetical protein FWG98_01420 [Candidatus Cloacimonetes bacterium]|nr:hypothetical protein [Candidatus Cloacimonadota bacterium]